MLTENKTWMLTRSFPDSTVLPSFILTLEARVALSAVDVIGPAFDGVKQQLFKPFRMSQWLRLAITGLLAGEMGVGGACTFRSPFNPARPSRPLPPFVSGGRGLIVVLAIGLLIVL